MQTGTCPLKIPKPERSELAKQIKNCLSEASFFDLGIEAMTGRRGSLSFGEGGGRGTFLFLFGAMPKRKEVKFDVL